MQVSSSSDFAHISLTSAALSLSTVSISKSLVSYQILAKPERECFKLIHIFGDK